MVDSCSAQIDRNRLTATVLDSVLISNSWTRRAESGDVVVKLIGNDPWQQFIDAIDGVLGDASDDVAQVGLGIKAIQFGGTSQSVDCGPAFAAAVGAEVQIVLSAESNGT